MNTQHYDVCHPATPRSRRIEATKAALGIATAELYAAGATSVRDTVQTALRRAPYVFRARYLQAKAHLQLVGRTG
jgi:hypothetical protein